MLRTFRKHFAKLALRLAEDDPRLMRQIAYRAMGTTRALARLSGLGVTVGSVIDVGASDGRWSRDAARVWPQARFHMVEANPAHGKALESLCRGRPLFSHVLAAAGDREGEIWFNTTDPFGGIAAREKQPGMVAVPVTTLAHEAESTALAAPYLIKLDTHGFEVPILEGSVPLLANVSALVIEVYNFTLEDGALRFWEMCAYLGERGFRVVDICEPGWRPHDHAFWQADFIFLREDAAVFASNAFRPD